MILELSRFENLIRLSFKQFRVACLLRLEMDPASCALSLVADTAAPACLS